MVRTGDPLPQRSDLAIPPIGAPESSTRVPPSVVLAPSAGQRRVVKPGCRVSTGTSNVPVTVRVGPGTDPKRADRAAQSTTNDYSKAIAPASIAEALVTTDEDL